MTRRDYKCVDWFGVFVFGFIVGVFLLILFWL